MGFRLLPAGQVLNSTPNSEAPLGGALPSRRTTLRRVLPRSLVSLLIAGGFAWALSRGGLPLAPPQQTDASMRWWALPGFMLFLGLAAFLRTARWYYLLRPLSEKLQRWRVLGMGLLGFSAVFFAPLRLGEVVRPYLLSQDGEVTFVQAVGSVAAERIIDGLVVALLTAGAFWLSTPITPLPDHIGSLPIPVSLVPGTILFAALMFSVAFAAMAAFYVAREPAQRLVRAVIGVISPRLAELCAGTVERLAQGFGFLPSWRSSGPFLRDTVLYWGAVSAAQWTLISGVGLECNLPQAFVTTGVIALGSLLPAGPGFFGAYQVAAYTSLAMFHPERELLAGGALFVFYSYATHVFLNVLVGLAGLMLLSRVPAASAKA
ncbi:MAG TPA: lysylphosphatidylglycerol synthase transmembrane domain-containing protein [Polyangiaceae bacterium]|nr:lysylphosphatidylglycerol synthase transmembrane domain-containing protein [Polyangiaceae bacterium]